MFSHRFINQREYNLEYLPLGLIMKPLCAFSSHMYTGETLRVCTNARMVIFVHALLPAFPQKKGLLGHYSATRQDVAQETD